MTVYLETTIPSYLVARRSRDPIIRGQQAATLEWWKNHRHRHEIFVSEFVAIEAGRGDPALAQARLKLIARLPRLSATQPVRELAGEIVRAGLVPATAVMDAAHIAVAAVHGMDFLLTWNCTHIHNVATIRRIEALCVRLGTPCPVVCTPFDMLES
jgi:predicted nucleic acid-binding protein